MKKFNTLVLLTAVSAGAYTLYQHYKSQNADSIIDENQEVGNTDYGKDSENDTTSFEKQAEQSTKRGYIHIPLHRE